MKFPFCSALRLESSCVYGLMILSEILKFYCKRCNSVTSKNSFMKLTERIQSTTLSSVTATIILALHNTSSFAAAPYADKQPVQTTISAPIVIGKPAFAVSAERQLLLFDRHLGVPVIKAPLWLMEHMKTLQQMPPPTLKDVETSFRAAEEMRSKYEDNLTSFSNGRKRPAT